MQEEKNSSPSSQMLIELSSCQQCQKSVRVRFAKPRHKRMPAFRLATTFLFQACWQHLFSPSLLSPFKLLCKINAMVCPSFALHAFMEVCATLPVQGEGHDDDVKLASSEFESRRLQDLLGKANRSMNKGNRAMLVSKPK